MVISATNIIERIRDSGLDLDCISVITEVEGVLINKTPLYIGKGRGSLGEIDNPVIKREYTRKPYIPGSSLKGALRSFAERLARASNYEVCDPFAESKVCAFRAALLSKLLSTLLEGIYDESKMASFVNDLARRYRIPTEYVKRANSILSELKSRPDVIDELKPCIVCRVFGTHALASHIIINDCDLISNNENVISTRTRVAIDRFRNAARSGALFDYEYVIQGCSWNFKVTLFNIDIIDGKRDVDILMRRTFEHLSTYGLVIGGMKSVGHGLLVLDSENTHIKKYFISDFSLSLEKDILLSKLKG